VRQAPLIRVYWASRLRARLSFWLPAGALALSLFGLHASQSLQAHSLVNVAAIEAAKGLFAPDGPDERQLEVARQTFYQAMETGHDPYAVLQRLREMESSRWVLQSQALKQRGQEWERVFTYQEWTRKQFDCTILDRWKSADPPDWYGLGIAAERMQLWSLAAHFYRHVQLDSSPEGISARLNYGQALLQLRRWAETETVLADSVWSRPADQSKANWLLAQSLVAQSRYAEAASLLQIIAVQAPNLIRTAKGVGVARQIAAHVPMTVTADVRSAWASAESNILTNSGFEDGYLGWGMWPEPGANNTIDDLRVYSGLQSFRVKFDGSQDVNYYQVGQTVAVQPGSTYSLTARIWAEGFTGHLGIEARGGEWFGGNTTQVNGSTGGWQMVTLVFTVPADITGVAITLRRYNGHGLVSGAIWIDDIVLEPW
jgi:hypothetical protein